MLRAQSQSHFIDPGARKIIFRLLCLRYCQTIKAMEIGCRLARHRGTLAPLQKLDCDPNGGVNSARKFPDQSRPQQLLVRDDLRRSRRLFQRRNECHRPAHPQNLTKDPQSRMQTGYDAPISPGYLWSLIEISLHRGFPDIEDIRIKGSVSSADDCHSIS